jgi:hypothetical protein
MKRLLPFFILASGCEVIKENPYLSPFIPTISFDRLDVNYIDFQEVDTEFVFAVDNPNPVGIDIEQFSYSLGFSDIEWMNGDNPDGLVLNPLDESTVSLPTQIVFTELYDMVQASRGLDSLPFALEGDFGVRLDQSTLVTGQEGSSEEEGELLELPYDVDGSFPALRRPTFTMEKLRVSDYSFTDLSLDLIIDVDNEHASNLIFNRFSYSIDLGGNDIVTGVADNLEEVIHGELNDEGERNRKLHIPIHIDTLSTVAQAWSIISGGGGVQLGLSALADVDTPFGMAELQMDENGNVDIELQ